MISGRLGCIGDEAVLPVSVSNETLGGGTYDSDHRVLAQVQSNMRSLLNESRLSRCLVFNRRLLALCAGGLGFCTLLACGAVFSQLHEASLPTWPVQRASIQRTSVAVTMHPLSRESFLVATSAGIAVSEDDKVTSVQSTPSQTKTEIQASAVNESAPLVWAPNSHYQERYPTDFPVVSMQQARQSVKVRVVTIRARVTAYTPFDHQFTKPEWCDGLVAWHPNGRKRRVQSSPYCLATDWGLFPGGSTFIKVPGYMDKSFPHFPECFRVVDDKCGRARAARRHGEQPIIDVRYMTRHSAISGRDAWGSQQLDVEVIYPDGFTLPADLRPWIRSVAWHTYQNGICIDKERITH